MKSQRQRDREREREIREKAEKKKVEVEKGCASFSSMATGPLLSSFRASSRRCLSRCLPLSPGVALAFLAEQRSISVNKRPETEQQALSSVFWRRRRCLP